MAWSTLRQATSEDRERLDTTARNFATRHNIAIVGGDNPVQTIEWAISDPDPLGFNAHLRKLWRARKKYALRDKRAEGIAWGYIGRNVDD